MTAPMTLPGRLVQRMERSPKAVAIREKKQGVWKETTWTEYYEIVSVMALALKNLGIEKDDHVAILSDNCPEWIIADLATQALGARSVGIYPTNPPEDVAYILNHAECKVIFCEDQEQVDKAVLVGKETPTVKHVVVIDPRGTRSIQDDRFQKWSELEKKGRELYQSDFLKNQAEKLDPDACSMVVYTSGTTGQPKGAMLSGRSALWGADWLNNEMGIGPHDQLLSYLPLCHVAEKIFSLYLPLTSGAVVHFGESINTVQEDLRDVSPTIFLGVPRIWEKIHSNVTLKMKDSSWLKRTLFNWAVEKGKKWSVDHYKKTLGEKIQYFFCDQLVYRALQERLGLRRCYYPVSGAAPIGKEQLVWFRAIGLKILEGYGMTENGGLSHVSLNTKFKLGTVGTRLSESECHIAEDGEILIRSPRVFLGYLHNPEATKETVDEEGWLHTGDIGEVDNEGFLKITGRKKEIIITSGGKNLSPEKIENALKLSPYIKEAVAIGDGRKYISSLIQIDGDAVGDWATRKKMPYTDFADLCSKEEVQTLIQKEIHMANDHLAQVEQVRTYRLIPKELHQDDGELTATQKVRRRAIIKIWANLIEELYK